MIGVLVLLAILLSNVAFVVVAGPDISHLNAFGAGAVFMGLLFICDERR